jgi:cellulose synthase/poly-beta-1,6-N-acetylglucosamine synthase-like glycosyltransferase
VWKGGNIQSPGFDGKRVPDIKVPVTVVIPFRDEGEHLPRLVGDLTSQNYPEELLEVVLVNDHSRDDPHRWLEPMIRGRQRFRCIDLPPGMEGKKAAISWGIGHASSDWIIQTDADCRIGPMFAETHMAFLYEHAPDMVAGLVTIREGSGGFLEHFERLDLLSLSGVGAGSFYFERPLMCSGANLLYSKRLYGETRSFDPSGKVDSGDDMFLMIGARKLGKRLSFCAAAGILAKTVPAGGIRHLLQQRIRWASKANRYGMADIQLVAVLVAVTSLSILLLPLWLILAPSSLNFLLPAILLKTGADFTLLHVVTGITRQRKSLWFFIPASLLYYLYQPVVVVGFLLSELMHRRLRWKDRSVSH